MEQASQTYPWRRALSGLRRAHQLDESLTGLPKAAKTMRHNPAPRALSFIGSGEQETIMSDFDSKEFVLAGIVMKRLLSGKQTGGQFCLLENRSDGNTKTPIHVHARDDETVYIIEGELTAVIEGKSRRLTAGESMFLPRGHPHQLVNVSGNPGKYILIGTPALFDRFLEEGGRELRPDEIVGPPTGEEIERLREASPRFGITLLADWPSAK
jgi:mannose-6-phosphate isomerase-like protein (cupin superfamily)